MSNEDAYLDVIRQIYPHALSTNETVDRFLDLMERRYGLKPEQIMSADSICSDDLNAIEYPRRAYEMLGPFKMGGLNGFPFTGLTGMNAFVHHVPTDGAVFIFYAPHVGITAEGKPGEILRPGQSEPSACCGAAKAALTKLLNDGVTAGELTELDYQQNTIEQIFLAQKERITQAAHPMLEATEAMYEAIGERIDTLVARTNFVCRHLILMGGILINASQEAGSYCCSRRLECIDLSSGERRDFLRELIPEMG